MPTPTNAQNAQSPHAVCGADRPDEKNPKTPPPITPHTPPMSAPCRVLGVEFSIMPSTVPRKAPPRSPSSAK